MAVSGNSADIEALTFQLLPGRDQLQLRGTLSSTTAQEEIAKRLAELHERIVERKLGSFTVDVRSLSFVNSSAIRVFVNWISRAEQAGYKLVFLTDKAVTWHRLSFSVLKSLAPNTVEIRDGGAKADGGS
jgi:anti-anti-sigma regulatory factor